jgi:hypothetical protein
MLIPDAVTAFTSLRTSSQDTQSQLGVYASASACAAPWSASYCACVRCTSAAVLLCASCTA